MTHHIDVLSAQKCSCSADVWELALSWWRVIRLRRLVFLISWKTAGKQMVVYHSGLTVLHCSSGTIATCPIFLKKQAIIYLEALCARATFVGFGSSWNIQSITVYFRAHTRKSTIHQLSRCYRCVSKHRDRIFGAFSSSDWQIVWDPTRKNFLIVHAILNVCCSL